MITSYSHYATAAEDECSCTTKWLNSLPIESLGYLGAAAISRVAIPALTAPFLGIATGLCITKLVLNILDRYNPTSLITLTKAACKFNKKYPKLQIIAFIFTLCMGLLNSALGFITGCGLGCANSFLIDAENYKLLQRANRVK